MTSIRCRYLNIYIYAILVIPSLEHNKVHLIIILHLHEPFNINYYNYYFFFVFEIIHHIFCISEISSKILAYFDNNIDDEPVVITRPLFFICTYSRVYQS